MIAKGYIKFSSELMFQEELLYSLLNNEVKNQSGYKKGKMFKFISMQIGYERDDFVMQLKTCLFTWNVVKASRICSRKAHRIKRNRRRKD